MLLEIYLIQFLTLGEIEEIITDTVLDNIDKLEFDVGHLKIMLDFII